MSSLQHQANAFKKRLANQEVISKPTIKSQSARQSLNGTPATTPSPSKTGSDNGITPKKRKKASFVYSQPADTGVGRHTGSQHLHLIEYLKSHDAPMHIGELASRTGIDIIGNPDLMEMLRKSERIVYDQPRQTVAYRPDYPIRSKDELAGLLEAQYYGRNPLPPSILAQRAANPDHDKSHPEKRVGLSVPALKESWAEVVPAIEELQKEGVVYVTRTVKDNSMRMVYWNPMSYVEENDQRKRLHIDDEFKEIWNGIKVPDEVDLPKELEKAGLKTAESAQTKKSSMADKQKKPKAKPRRRQKITNTHMAGIVQNMMQ